MTYVVTVHGEVPFWGFIKVVDGVHHIVANFACEVRDKDGRLLAVYDHAVDQPWDGPPGVIVTVRGDPHA